MIALVVHTVFGTGGYMDLQKRDTELQRMKDKVEDLEKENRRLTGEVKSLKNDPAAIERVAREQLKLVKPGERVITIPEKKQDKDNPSN